jgi:hypothetical protein
MAGRRLATVVVAVALIAGALLIRRNVIEGDDDDGGVSATTAGPEPATALVCLAELEAVCEGLDTPNVRIEDAGETLGRLAAGEAVPLWLTFEPFPAMATEPLVAGDVLAASQLAVAVPADYGAPLTALCADQALWACVGEQAGEAWGDAPGVVKPSVGDAQDSAAGLASFASAVAGYFGTTGFGSIELQDPTFLAWVRPFVREVPVGTLVGGTPLATMLVRPSAVNVAGTSDAEIAAVGAPGEGIDSRYPEPSMWLQAVLAAPAGADIPQELATDATAALVAAGWDPPAASQSPLPSPTTMLALQQLWEDLQ